MLRQNRFILRQNRFILRQLTQNKIIDLQRIAIFLANIPKERRL